MKAEAVIMVIPAAALQLYRSDIHMSAVCSSQHASWLVKTHSSNAKA